MIPTEDGIYSGITDIEYHADRGSLSSSGARKLLAPSCPAIFAYERDQPPNPKPQYDFGHAAHKYVLGEGSVIEEIDAPNWQTKAAGEARKKAWSEDKVPLLSKDVAKAQEMANIARDHPVLRELLKAPDFTPELSGYWTDPETGVRLRFRPDGLCQIRGQIVGLDYKTTTDASPEHCAKAVADYGYHMQDAWYRDGLIATEITNNPDFLIAFQSKNPPHLVTVVRIRPHHVELGRRRNRKAIQLYHQCIQRDDWPGYGDHIHDIDLPTYAVYRQEAELER